MRKLMLLLCFIPFMLCGCGGNEIEGRNFVSVMGFDVDENGEYNVSVGFVTPGGENMYTAESKNIDSSSAYVTDKLKSSGKRQMYFGHLKSVIINTNILKNEDRLNEILLSASSNNDISMETIILSSDYKASDIVGVIKEAGDGLYIWDFYRNNRNGIFATYKLTLGDAIKMCDNYGSVVIPSISYDDEGINIEGGVMCSQYRYVGKLNQSAMRGFCLISELAKGSVETISYNGVNIPFLISKNTVNKNFYEENGVLCADLNISIKAKSQMHSGTNLSDMQSIVFAIEEEIYNEASAALAAMHGADCDATGLCYSLMKDNYGLYSKYKADDMFKNMRINVNVDVETV